MKRLLIIAIFLLSSLPTIVFSNGTPTIYVNNLIGNDEFSGLSKTVNGNTGPVKSIQKAFDIVKTSGKIEIINTGIPYLTGNRISKGGTPEAPLIIEGNGSEINGLGMVDIQEWKLVEKRIYSRPFWPMSNQLRSNKDYNFWIETPKVWWVNNKPGINCKSKTELEATPGGFWWNKAQQSVWFHLPKGTSFESLEIKMPLDRGFGKGTGININGKIKNVIIQNLKVKYAYNDGFSAHGDIENVTFRNCISTDNCGQGFSMHGNTKILVTDSYASRNASSGSCDVNNCEVTYRRCVFRNNSFEAGVYTTETVKATYEDCIISNNQPFEQIWQRGLSMMSFKNSIIEGFDSSKPIATIDKGSLTFDNCTLINGTSVGTGKSHTPSLFINNCLLIDIKDISHQKASFTIHNSETNTRSFINDNNDIKYIEVKQKNKSFPTSKKTGAKLPASVIKMYHMDY
jgi:hypothetical protein